MDGVPLAVQVREPLEDLPEHSSEDVLGQPAPEAVDGWISTRDHARSNEITPRAREEPLERAAVHVLEAEMRLKRWAGGRVGS